MCLKDSNVGQPLEESSRGPHDMGETKGQVLLESRHVNYRLALQSNENPVRTLSREVQGCCD